MRLVTKEICPEDEALDINVRRDFVVHDAIREGKKKKFTTTKKLKVRVYSSNMIPSINVRR